MYGHYEILDQIGRGSFATVHRAIFLETGEICAVKRMHSPTSELRGLMNEIAILNGSKCKNIVRFLTSDCDGKEVLIFMEYCVGGSVKDVMRRLNITLNVEQITVIVRDVLNGLDYLHSGNNIHRDVKAANILLNEDGIAKLGDFGVSEPLDTSPKVQENTRKTIIGTLLWLPPEVLNQNCNESTLKSIDIWSLGITIIEMADGEPPYNSLQQEAATHEIANMDRPPSSFKDPTKWPQDLLDFVSSCLMKDAARRKSACELLNHDLIKTRCLSNDSIKSLVAESSSSSNSKNQSENYLFEKSKVLKREIACLEQIYQNRRLKCIRVDRMTDSYLAVEREFSELETGSRERNKRIVSMMNQVRAMKEKIQGLQREKSELNSRLIEKRARKSELDNELAKIREKLEDESKRKSKLKALESS